MRMRMLQVRWLLLAAVLLLMLHGSMARRGGRGRKRQRGCRREAGQGLSMQGQGTRYAWSVNTLNDDDLAVSFIEGAFVPEESSTVFKYPISRGQRAIGLVPAKVFYDFSDPQQPAAVIRQGHRGRGSCIIITPDVTSYDDAISLLQSKNGSSNIRLEEYDDRDLVATETNNDTQFSQVVRDLCSKDPCGRPIEPVYYTTSSADADNTEDDVTGDDDIEENDVDAWRPRFVLLNSQVTVSGLNTPRHDRRQRRLDRRRHRGRHPDPLAQAPEAAVGGRQAGRQARRQQRRQQRQDRRRQGRGGRRGSVYGL